jgi:translocator protein
MATDHRRTLLRLAICVLAPLAAGAIGSAFTAGSVQTWYPTLAKPSFTPPAWVFGPVWTALYLLMGVAAFLVWQRGWQRPMVRAGLAFFAGQLVLNAAWSIVFFGAHSVSGAFLVLVLLWLSVLATTLLFGRVRLASALLMVPYLAWITFAAFLNAEIMRLNP